MVGPLALGIGLLCKNKKQKGSTGAHSLLLRCLSQFFHVEENINCLGNEVLCICLRIFHRWGGLVFIMDDHDNFLSWMMTLNSIVPYRRTILNSIVPNWMMTVLGPCFGPIFGDVSKGPTLVLGLLLNPFLSLAFGLVFWACTPIILNLITNIPTDLTPILPSSQQKPN